MSNSVLVLFAHPTPHRSRANRRLIRSLRGIEGVTLHDLYHNYPDHDIDVEREKALLGAHDLIVWQHPFYWYSLPPLMKEWQDRVLEFGWAYGPNGHALRGKRLLPALTTSGSEAAYRADGANRYTIRQLLAPLDQTCHLCGMEMLDPFVVYATQRLSDEALDEAAVSYRKHVLMTAGMTHE